MSVADGSREAVRRLLDGAAAAESRADWPAALTMAEAAAALAPADEDVVAAIARARAGSDARTTETGTRRRVTVMFCDLAGSTEIAAALDPEETREILHAYHEACGAIVRRYDGHVAHLMGDGLLVYFGYPRGRGRRRAGRARSPGDGRRDDPAAGAGRGAVEPARPRRDPHRARGRLGHGHGDLGPSR